MIYKFPFKNLQIIMDHMNGWDNYVISLKFDPVEDFIYIETVDPIWKEEYAPLEIEEIE